MTEAGRLDRAPGAPPPAHPQRRLVAAPPGRGARVSVAWWRGVGRP